MAYEDLFMSILLVCGIGAAGGLINALVTENGVALPQRDPHRRMLLRLGAIGNILVGMFAAFLAWTLYSPLSGASTITFPPATLSLGASGLAGFAGARWLTAEVEKRVLKGAVGEALASAADPQAAGLVAGASPVEAARIVRHVAQSQEAEPSGG